MKLGYYAHHHGSGHLRSAYHFAQALGDKLTIVSSHQPLGSPSLPEGAFVALAPEDPSPTDLSNPHYQQPHYIHYSPRGNPNLLQRAHQLLAAVYERGIDLMIVDVSVEVVSLCKVAGIPYAYVNMHGARNDSAHLDAYRGAEFLLGYYPRQLAAPKQDWVEAKTYYTGFLSTNGRGAAESSTLSKMAWRARYTLDDAPTALLISGYGGNREMCQALPRITATLPGYQWLSLGPIEDPTGCITHPLGCVQNIASFLQYVDVIVAAPGLNLVGEILTAGRRFIALPQ